MTRNVGKYRERAPLTTAISAILLGCGGLAAPALAAPAAAGTDGSNGQAAEGTSPSVMSRRRGPPRGRGPQGTGGMQGEAGAGGSGGSPGSGGASNTSATGGAGGTDGGAGGAGGTGGTTALDPQPVANAFLGGFFPLAVDGPLPADYIGSTDCAPAPGARDYSGWSSCGINTIARGPDCSDDSCPASFDARVTAAGLHMIRAPLPSPTQDAANHATDKLLLAWALPDEPDANGGLSANISGLQSRYAALTAVANHPPIYLNVGGSDLLVTNQPYAQALAATDWLADDIYPVSGFLDDSLTRNDLTLVGRVLDRFGELSPGKPRFAWIETNNILGQADPSPAQVRAEIWIAIVHGARGILYFEEQVEPVFNLESTSGPVRTEMGKQHSIISRLAGVLQGEINPAGVGAAAAAPFSVGWRRSTEGTVVVVVNTSATARAGASITLTGANPAGNVAVFGEGRTLSSAAGKLIDDFDAYAVHIYVVP